MRKEAKISYFLYMIAAFALRGRKEEENNCMINQNVQLAVLNNNLGLPK
jgi:hypothetical protein